MYQTCQLPIFHNANLPIPEMLHCNFESVGLQINTFLMCIKLVGRIAYYHRGHIALKHGSDWNIPMSEFHLAIWFLVYMHTFSPPPLPLNHTTLQFTDKTSLLSAEKERKLFFFTTVPYYRSQMSDSVQLPK